MLGSRLALVACREVSSVTASGTCVSSASTVTSSSISLVTCIGLMMTPSSSSQATAKYAVKIHAAASNVAVVVLEPTMYSAIDGTQISARNSSTGKLRSEWCRYQSPSGSRSLSRSASAVGPGRADGESGECNVAPVLWPAAEVRYRTLLLIMVNRGLVGGPGCPLAGHAAGSSATLTSSRPRLRTRSRTPYR